MNTNESLVKEAEFFKIQIYGDEWVIYKLDESDDVITDKNLSAETDFYKKHIYFRDIDLATCRHECLHAFMGYTYSSTADLTGSQVEEILCELFSDKAEIILQKSLEIHKGLKKL